MTSAPAPSTRLPWTALLCAALVALGLAVNALSLRALPNFSIPDEFWYLNYADTYRATGEIAAPFFPGSRAVLMGRLYPPLAAGWLGATGGGIFELRALSALGGLALLAAVVGIAYATGGPRRAWITAAVCALNLYWLTVSHVARADMWAAAFSWAAAWLVLRARAGRSPWAGLAAGLVAALALEMHPLAALNAAALGLAWLTTPGALRADRRALAGFIAGGAVGGLLFALNHLLPDPAAFFDALRTESSGAGAFDFGATGAMGVRLLYYLFANPVECLLLYGVFALALFRARSLGLPLRYALITFGLYFFIVGDVNMFYAIAWMPGLVLALGWALDTAAGRQRALVLVLAALAVGITLVQVAGQVREDWNGRVIAAVEQAAPALGDAGRILGSSAFYAAARGGRFVSDHALSEQVLAGGAYAETLAALDPDVVVAMRWDEAGIPRSNVLGYVFNTPPLALPEALAAALPERYRLTREIETPGGTVQLWSRR